MKTSFGGFAILFIVLIAVRVSAMDCSIASGRDKQQALSSLNSQFQQEVESIGLRYEVCGLRTNVSAAINPVDIEKDLPILCKQANLLVDVLRNLSAVHTGKRFFYNGINVTRGNTQSDYNYFLSQEGIPDFVPHETLLVFVGKGVTPKSEIDKIPGIQMRNWFQVPMVCRNN